MREPSQMPEWREPPMRLGPIEPLEGRIIEFLDEYAVPITIAIAIGVLAIAGYVFGVDWLAGHL